jgi:hypothetical protein
MANAITDYRIKFYELYVFTGKWKMIFPVNLSRVCVVFFVKAFARV